MKAALKWVVDYVDGLITKTAGQGRSVQSFVYLFAGVAAIMTAVAMALAACIVGIYAAMAPLLCSAASVFTGAICAPVSLDGVFWSGFFACLTALWAAAFGYIASAKKNSTNATKEITLAGMPQAPSPPPPPSTTTTKKVSVEATTTGPAPEGDEP